MGIPAPSADLSDVLRESDLSQNGGNLAELDQAADFVGGLSADGVSVLTAQYIGEDTSINYGDTVTFAHGLGVVPSHCEAYLVCTSADSVFSVGDVIYGLGLHVNSGQEFGYNLSSDATNIRVQFGLNDIGRAFDNSGQYVSLTEAKWKLVVVAYV